MRRLILPLLILFLGVAFGQEAILTTTLTYPDTLVAGVIGARDSIPIFLTYRDILPPEVLSELQQLNITKIYIIGGPAVVSEAVENTLVQNGFEVVRLWGMTRFGTACEVAQYFWPTGSNKVVITWDQLDSPEQNLTTAQQLAIAKELAVAEKVPLLIIPRDTLPWTIADCLAQLRVSRVKIVGDIGEMAKRKLAELAFNIEEEFTGNLSQIQERVRSRIRERIGKSLIVAAVGNWTDVVKAPYHPGNGTVRLISSEAEIEQLIEEIQTYNYTNIKIVGKPDLAQRIWDALASKGINSTLVSAKPLPQQVIQNVEDHLNEMKKIRERLRVQIQEMKEMFKETIRETIDKCMDQYLESVRKIEEIGSRVVIPGRPAIMDELNRTRDELQRRIAENKTIEAYESCLRLRKLVHLVKWKTNQTEELIDVETKPFNLTIGVKSGDYIRYMVGDFEIMVRILEVNQSEIKLQVTGFRESSNQTITLKPTLAPSEGPFIPANLSESYLISRPPFWVVSVETKEYLGKVREVIRIKRERGEAYYDKLTGVLLELREDSNRLIIKETNIF